MRAFAPLASPLSGSASPGSRNEPTGGAAGGAQPPAACRSPAERVGIAPRVGAADARAGLGVHDDGADAAGRAAPVVPDVDPVAAPLQLVAHLGRDAPLDVEQAGVVAVRPEGVGEALAHDARLLDRP